MLLQHALQLCRKHLTIKQVQLKFQKMSIEFMKRMDPDLPLHYFTSAHDHFLRGPLPDFDQPKREEIVLYSKTSSSSWPTGKSYNWMCKYGNTRYSTQVEFHKVPIDLSPPHSADINSVDHSYFWESFRYMLYAPWKWLCPLWDASIINNINFFGKSFTSYMTTYQAQILDFLFHYLFRFFVRERL